MRRLQAAASNMNGQTPKLTSTGSMDIDLGPEPKKPPRKSSKAKGDSADGSGSYVDVTYAL